MQTTPMRSLMAGLALLTIAGPVAAHHSFAGEYDQSRPLRIEGTVVRVDWRNPHVILTLASMTTPGVASTWTFEMGAPRVLTERLGWPKDALKPGDHIVVDGYYARNGGTQAAAQFVTTASGTRLRSVLPFR